MPRGTKRKWNASAGGALFSACNGHWPPKPKKLQKLIANGANPNKRVGRGCIGSSTPLHQAARNGYVEAVKLMLKAGAIPDERLGTGEKGGETPVELAASSRFSNGQKYIVDLLLRAGAKLTLGNWLLKLTKNDFYVKNLQHLLSCGLRVNEQPEIYMNAAKNGSVQCLTFLLGLPHSKDERNVAFQSAVINGRPLCITALLAYKSDPNMEFNSRMLPCVDLRNVLCLFGQEWSPATRALHVLCSRLPQNWDYDNERDSSDNCVEAEARRAKFEVAEAKKQADCIKSLILHGADPDAKDGKGQSPISLTTGRLPEHEKILQAALLTTEAPAKKRARKRATAALKSAIFKLRLQKFDFASEIVDYAFAKGAEPLELSAESH